MNKRQAFGKKTDAIKTELEQKRKNFHYNIEEKVKQEMKKMKGGGCNILFAAHEENNCKLLCWSY